MSKFEILKEIKMTPDQRALVRFRFGRDHWQFGHWDGTTFDVILTEYGERMMYSSNRVSFQSKVAGQDGYEAWVFHAEDYDRAWQMVCSGIFEIPLEVTIQKARPQPVTWLGRLFGKIA